jgi:hypothetical protein
MIDKKIEGETKIGKKDQLLLVLQNNETDSGYY